MDYERRNFKPNELLILECGKQWIFVQTFIVYRILELQFIDINYSQTYNSWK